MPPASSAPWHPVSSAALPSHGEVAALFWALSLYDYPAPDRSQIFNLRSPLRVILYRILRKLQHGKESNGGQRECKGRDPPNGEGGRIWKGFRDASALPTADVGISSAYAGDRGLARGAPQKGEFLNEGVAKSKTSFGSPIPSAGGRKPPCGQGGLWTHPWNIEDGDVNSQFLYNSGFQRGFQPFHKHWGHHARLHQPRDGTHTFQKVEQS